MVTSTDVDELQDRLTSINLEIQALCQRHDLAAAVRAERVSLLLQDMLQHWRLLRNARREQSAVQRNRSLAV